MFKKACLTCFSLLFSLVWSVKGEEGFKIHLSVPSIPQKEVIMGYHFNGKMLVKDTLQLDAKGEGIWKGSETLDQGVYVLYMPNKQYMDLVIGADQNFSLRTDTTDFLQKTKISGASETAAFLRYQKFMGEMQKRKQPLIANYRKLKPESDSITIIREKMKGLDQEVERFMNNLIDDYKGFFLSSMLHALQPVKIPDFEVPENAAKRDSILGWKRYYYNCNHFLDNVDVGDARLWRTPFMTKKIDYYLDKALIQHPDTIKPHALKLVSESRENKEAFRFMCQHILNFSSKSKIMGMDGLFVEMADSYYATGEAYWADSSVVEKVIDYANKCRFNRIGMKAPELLLEGMDQEHFSLHQVEAPYTLLFFWEPGCSHCKKAVPKVNEVLKRFKDRGLAVYGVYTQTDKEEWEAFINEKELFDWINVYDPHNFSGYRLKYNVYSTPVLYLLDKDKKILAKQIDVGTAEKMLERLYEKGSLF